MLARGPWIIHSVYATKWIPSAELAKTQIHLKNASLRSVFRAAWIKKKIHCACWLVTLLFPRKSHMGMYRHIHAGVSSQSFIHACLKSSTQPMFTPIQLCTRLLCEAENTIRTKIDLVSVLRGLTKARVETTINNELPKWLFDCQQSQVLRKKRVCSVRMYRVRWGRIRPNLQVRANLGTSGQAFLRSECLGVNWEWVGMWSWVWVLGHMHVYAWIVTHWVEGKMKCHGIGKKNMTGSWTIEKQSQMIELRTRKTKTNYQGPGNHDEEF